MLQCLIYHLIVERECIYKLYYFSIHLFQYCMSLLCDNFGNKFAKNEWKLSDYTYWETIPWLLCYECNHKLCKNNKGRRLALAKGVRMVGLYKYLLNNDDDIFIYNCIRYTYRRGRQRQKVRICIKMKYNQRTWTVYTYWPVSLLLTSGGLLPAAWNTHDKRQTPDTNCSITNQLLADWSRGRAAHRGGPCKNSDEEMGLSRRRPVGGLRLRGATDDGPPPLLPSTSTRRGLRGWRPGHSDRAGKGMCPQVGENCVKDTKEEDLW